MKLSISNIAWDDSSNKQVYMLMKIYGFSGLEIAPTRVFPEKPYDKLVEAKAWAKRLYEEYGLVVPSMQSIWYGKNEKLFGTDDERSALLEYTKKAILFAEAIGCKNLVFGCPRNRNMPENADPNIAISFFKEIGDFAWEHNTCIGMEANPPIYNTNYINDTASALELIEKVDSRGFLLNLDIGTMIQNNEVLNELNNNISFINHIHISEPGLNVIEQRKLHTELRSILDKENYTGYISIEMCKVSNKTIIEQTMAYIKEVFA